MNYWRGRGDILHMRIISKSELSRRFALNLVKESISEAYNLDANIDKATCQIDVYRCSHFQRTRVRGNNC